MHCIVAIGKFKLELQSGNAQFGSKSTIFVPCDLEIWRMTLKNNRAPLLSNIKLCASFHRHMWIQIGVTVKWGHDLYDLDLGPWTSLLSMAISPENFMMMRWQGHSEKGVTDRQTDRRTGGRTERGFRRAAWPQLKTCIQYCSECKIPRLKWLLVTV